MGATFPALAPRGPFPLALPSPACPLLSLCLSCLVLTVTIKGKHKNSGLSLFTHSYVKMGCPESRSGSGSYIALSPWRPEEEVVGILEAY